MRAEKQAVSILKGSRFRNLLYRIREFNGNPWRAIGSINHAGIAASHLVPGQSRQFRFSICPHDMCRSSLRRRWVFGVGNSIPDNRIGKRLPRPGFYSRAKNSLGSWWWRPELIIANNKSLQYFGQITYTTWRSKGRNLIEVVLILTVPQSYTTTMIIYIIIYTRPQSWHL